MPTFLTLGLQIPRFVEGFRGKGIPRVLQSRKTLWKKMNHRTGRRAILPLIPRHTASKFLSPKVLRCGRIRSGEESAPIGYHALKMSSRKLRNAVTKEALARGREADRDQESIC